MYVRMYYVRMVLRILLEVGGGEMRLSLKRLRREEGGGKSYVGGVKCVEVGPFKQGDGLMDERAG